MKNKKIQLKDLRGQFIAGQTLESFFSKNSSFTILEVSKSELKVKQDNNESVRTIHISELV